MKIKKVIVSICTFIMISSLCTTAFGASGINSAKHRPELSAEQKAKKAEMAAKMKATHEKWNALTKEQKEEVYSLKDKAADIEMQIIDKYFELGILEKETAEDIKVRLSEKNKHFRESGKMPWPGARKFKHGKTTK